MYARLFWYCGVVIIAGLTLLLAWRTKRYGLLGFRVLALWATSLAVGALPNVTRAPSSVGMFAVAQAATYVAVGSLLLYALLVPRVTALTLRRAGWAHMRVRDAGVGILLGLIGAVAFGPVWPHALLSTSVTGTRLAYLIAVQMLGVGWQEETLFRGFILEVIKRTHQARTDLAVVCQAVLFAAYAAVAGLASWVMVVGVNHFSVTSVGPLALQAFAYHLLMGLIFGYLRERVNGLLAPYAAHVTLNITVIMSRGY